ncbi:HNH endonuclease [Natrinema soli]|uniref:HNH endonuclease n=1 Tax=Natrinema soli TaxID=1930624 RepID=A0ABD5SRT2_9EURY|nr:HNH endonuclease [Natrinema soli]
MGVVRRDGDWRLEKLENGVYAITFDNALEAKVVTSDYDPGIYDERFDITAPVHEVDSFQDAVDLLEQFASSGNPSPMGGLGGFGNSDGGIELEFPGDGVSDGESGIGDLPPGGISLVLLIAGGIVVFSSGLALDSISLLIGITMLVSGIAIIGWVLVLAQRDGVSAAIKFLSTIEDDSKVQKKDSQSSNGPEKTPPTPQSLKDELYFERAGQQCEWCNNRTDQPEVHHITPRSEGGPNEPSNLIVLCPGCHAKADRGAISKTKLQSKVRRIAQ